MPEFPDTCITDCSILNMTTCSPQPRQKETIYNLLELNQSEWVDEYGCYNSSILKNTIQYQKYTEFSTIVSILMIFVSCVGLIGNILSILVLSRKSMRSCFNNILISLNLSDCTHLMFAILDGIRNSFVSYYPQWLLFIFPYFHYPLYRISLCCSICLIISMAIERHSAVCNPLTYREQHASGRFRSILYILPSCLIALLINISRFLETETLIKCVDFSDCGQCSQGPLFLYYIKPTALRFNKEYITYYATWMWVIVTGVLPFAILLFLNYKILRSFRRLQSRITRAKINNSSSGSGSPRIMRQQSRDVNMSLVLISTVAVFLLCHTPRLVTSVYESINIGQILFCRDIGRDNTPLWYMYFTAAVQLLMVVNASFNLPIYFFAGQHFRETLLELFGCNKPSNSVVVVKKTNSNTGSFKKTEPNPDVNFLQIKSEEKTKNCEKTLVETTIMNTLQDHVANNKISVTSL